jgi:zinc protease
MSCVRLHLLVFFCLTAARGLAGETEVAAADEGALFKTAASLYDDVKTETLANGLRVYLKPIPGSPVVTAMVAYRVGAGDEDLDQTGLSHYLEHLLFKGTEKLSPGDIDRQTQRNGGRNNAYTSEDMTVYHFDFAADRWAVALQIEADRMRNTRIDAKHEFQQEKGAVISELNGNEDRPWELEQKAILPLLFGPKSPYGHPVIGERKHVECATAEIIKRHYDRWYHPNNAALVIVGGFDEKKTLESIHQLFDKIPKAELPERRPAPAPPVRTATVRKKMASKFESPRMLFGFNTVASGSRDVYALDVIQSVLAGGKTGRLYHKLIDEDKIAVAVGAAHSPGRCPGWFEINAELFKGDWVAVERIVAAELKKLADDGVTEAELKRAKRGLVAASIFDHESTHSIADAIARGVSTNDLNYVKKYLPKIAAVTNDDIKKAARQYLVDAKGVVVWSIPDGQKEKGFLPPEGPLTAKPASRTLRRAATKGGASAFALGNAKSVTLANGLTIWLLENHRLPLVAAEISIGRVSMVEPADKLGVAALVGSLLDEGTTTRTNHEIAQLIECTGGALSLSSSGGTLKVLTPDLERGVDVLFDCILNSTFPIDELEKKREETLAAIAEEDKRPNERAQREFRALVYGAHPYGRPNSGTAESVRKLTRKDCRAFHQAVFRPNNATIAFVGDFDPEKIVTLMEKHTAGWQRAELPALPKVAVELPKKLTQKIISDPEAAQLHVYIGHAGIKRDNPDYFKLLVMDNVLGTGPGFTDRLSANLRDRQGLAYTVSAEIAASAGEEPGAFTGYIGTFPDKYTWVRDGFIKEIRKIRDEAPSQQEVEDAIKYLTGSLAFRTISCDQVAGLLLAVDRYGLGLDYLDDYRKAVSAVSAKDVQTVARKYLDPDRLVIVAVGAIDEDARPLKKE